MLPWVPEQNAHRVSTARPWCTTGYYRKGAPFNLSLTVPRYTNGRACDLNSLQESIHVSRLSFFTHSCTRIFFVSSLKERNYIYSMYLSTVKVGFNGIRDCSQRELRVDSGVRGTQHASRRGTPWGVKPVDNGLTAASHTAADRTTPVTYADDEEPAEAS